MTAIALLLLATETLGDRERAEMLYAHLEPFAEQCTVILTGAGVGGSNHLYLGLGARAPGVWTRQSSTSSGPSSTTGGWTRS